MSTEVDLSALHEIPEPTTAPASLAPPPALPPSPARGAHRARRVVAAVVAIVAAFGAAAGLGLRADLAGSAAIVSTVLVVLGAAATSYVAATRASGLRWPLWVALPFALFAVAGLLHVGEGEPDSMLRATVACLAASIALAAVPLAALVLAFRHAFATSASRRSLALGVAAGALAAAAMELHCAVGSLAHMLVGHGAALLLAGLAGLAAARLTRA